MKKVISIILVAVMVLSICACGSIGSSQSGNNASYGKSTITKSEAISKAKESKTVQDAIARKFGMKQYYTPDWGICTAEKTGTQWTVTLKGTISGYTDEYHDDFDYDKKFTATVKVEENGYVSTVSVSKSY